jgi:hypothetical protein
MLVIGIALLPMLRRVATSGVPATPTGCCVEKVSVVGKTTAVAAAVAPILSAKLFRCAVAVSVTGKSDEEVSPTTKASPVVFAAIAGE